MKTTQIKPFETIDLKINNFMQETFKNGILTEVEQSNKDYKFKSQPFHQQSVYSHKQTHAKHLNFLSFLNFR